MKQAINLFLSILWDVLKADYYLSTNYIDRKISPLINLLGSVLNDTQINNLSRFFSQLSKALNGVNNNINKFKNLGPNVLERLHNEKTGGFKKIAEYVNNNEEIVFEDGFKKSTPEFIKSVVDPVYDKIEELKDTKIVDIERFIDNDDEIKEFFARHLEDLMFEDFIEFGEEIYSSDELEYDEILDITKSKEIGNDYLEGFINGVISLIREDWKKDKSVKYTRFDILELEKITVNKYYSEYYENRAKWTDELEDDIKREIKKWKQKMKK